MSGSEFVEKKSSSVPNQTHHSLQPRRLQIPLQAQSDHSIQETASIEEQLERTSKFGYDGLNVPVNDPQTPALPVQRQSAGEGLENQSQEQVVPEIEANSEQVEETPQREELVLAEALPNQELPDKEGEGEAVPQTVQPEGESGEHQPQKPFLQAQLEKASKFGYNGLDVPVNTPSTPSPRIQRKLTLDGLDNQYQPEVIERANPVLNGLHQFKIQRQPQTTERTDRRTDRRTERETESDRRRRRPAGGRERDRREGGDLDSDWAGRMILYRYLTGGGDWQINNDPQWTAYMTANASLTSQIRTKLLLKAQNLCSRGSSDQSFYESFPIAIENGEGIIGYQYLHGTNADVGGFGMGGTAEITRNQGRCTVKFNLSYTWNDIIDPNPQYDTDTLKSLFAEIITFGQAQAYVIRITWNQETVVTLKETGSLIAIQGWPGN